MHLGAPEGWQIWKKYGDRLSMKGRIFLGMTLSRIVFLPVILLAIYFINEMVEATNRIATVDAKVARLADQVAASVGDMRRAEKNFLLLRDPSYLGKLKELTQVVTTHLEDGFEVATDQQESLSAMKAAVKIYVATVDRLAQATEPIQDRDIVNQFAGAVKNYQGAIDSLLAIAMKAESQEEITESIDEISKTALSFDRHLADSLIEADPKRAQLLRTLGSQGDRILGLARLVNENSWKKVESQRRQTEQLGSQAVLLIYGILAATLVLSFALTWYLPRKVIQPVREVTQALRKASNGNYDIFLNLTARDELGELVNEFHNLVDHMRGRETQQQALPAPAKARAAAAHTSSSWFG